MTPPLTPPTPADNEHVAGIDALAQEIRRVDGNHSLGAGALAEALWPYVRALRQGGWQPMETCPNGEVLLYWPATKPARRSQRKRVARNGAR